MPPLTPEETDRWRELYPMLPLEGDAPTGAMQAAPALAAPAISTGQAPPSLAAPGSISARLEQLAAESKAREAAMSQAPGFGVKDALALGIAGAGDAASRIAAIRRGSGTPTNTFGAMLKAQQETQTQRASALMDERKFGASLLNSLKTSQGADLTAAEKAAAIAGNFGPGATPEDLKALREQAVGIWVQAGYPVDLATRLADSAQRIPDLSSVVGKYGAVWDKSNPTAVEREKLALSQVGLAARRGKDPEVRTLFMGHVASEINTDAMTIALMYAKDPQNAGRKGDIPLQDLFALYRATKGPAAFAYEEFVSGRLPEMSETLIARNAAALTDMGYRGLEVAGKAQVAGATTAATKQAEVNIATEPGNVAKEAEATNARERLTRGEKLNTQKLEDVLKLDQAERIKALDARFKAGEPMSPESVSGVRKEFTAQSKTFVDVAQSYGRIQASAQNPSAAGDLALIFGYMKMLDPGSTVREGEFATAESARGVPETLRTLYNKVASGQKLGDDQRKDFVDRAGKLFSVYLGTQKDLESSYRSLAKRLQIDPETVVLDYVQQYRRPAGPSLPTPTHRFDPKTGKMVPVKP